MTLNIFRFLYDANVYLVRTTQSNLPRSLDRKHGMRNLMLRNGATTWQLQQDLDDPNRFRMEMLVASWSEHLRQHERMTRFESKTLEIVASYHLDGEPVPVKHFLSVDREVFLLGQTTK
jgi:Transmembrane secretion effector